MRIHGYLIVGTLVLAVLCAGLPTHSLADIEADLAAAIEDRLNGLIGTEYLPPPLSDPSVELLLGLAMPVTIEGYAFCTPSDLWAAPNPSPVPPNNAYGCTNDVQIDVTYVSETEYTVAINIPAFFIDLSTLRTSGLVLPLFCNLNPLVPCVCNEPVNPGIFISGEEYILGTAGISGALAITTGGGGCVQASVVPGSVQSNVISQVLGIRGDQCLMDFQSDFEDLLLLLVEDEETWNELFDQALDDAVSYFNGLCVGTNETTWGRIKALYGNH